MVNDCGGGQLDRAGAFEEVGGGGLEKPVGGIASGCGSHLSGVCVVVEGDGDCFARGFL